MSSRGPSPQFLTNGGYCGAASRGELGQPSQVPASPGLHSDVIQVAPRGARRKAESPGSRFPGNPSARGSRKLGEIKGKVLQAPKPDFSRASVPAQGGGPADVGQLGGQIGCVLQGRGLPAHSEASVQVLTTLLLGPGLASLSQPPKQPTQIGGSQV